MLEGCVRDVGVVVPDDLTSKQHKKVLSNLHR